MKQNKLYEEAKLVIDSMLEPSPMIDLNNWTLNRTTVVVIDMINGFAKSGALYSDRVENIINSNVQVLDNFNCEHIFLCDYHKTSAEEFGVFLPHCTIGSGEEEIVDALKPFAEKALVIHKNSTNGFIEPEFQSWLESTEVDQYIITGCCTDLCVIQFVLSLKTHYNRINKSCKIAVIENAIETYDINAIHHPGDFTNLMSLKMMKDNGILLRRI